MHPPAPTSEIDIQYIGPNTLFIDIQYIGPNTLFIDIPYIGPNMLFSPNLLIIMTGAI